MDRVPKHWTELTKFAHEALEHGKNDTQRSVRWGVQYLLRHRDRLRVLLEEVIKDAVTHRTMNVVHRQRRTILERVEREETQMSATKMAGLIAIASDALLQYPLPGGKLMREAVKPELEAGAAWFLRGARTYMITVKWFRAVAAQLPDDKTPVGRAFTEAQLRTLYKQAETSKATTEPKEAA